MMKKLKNISADNDLNYYYNAENIPNQDLVFGTIDYFENGKRKGFFEPLEFLNLLWEQYNYIRNNVHQPHTVITTLKGLPLDNEQKHVLFGFILKWFGGYPINNQNEQYNSTLRLIEIEFLKYEGQTPEKEFCQRNWDQYKQTKQIEAFANDKINFSNTGRNKHSISEPPDKSILILSKRKGAKVDLIRVLNALYELKLIKLRDEQIPSKEQFMKLTGDFLGIDLSNYHTDLSQAFNNTTKDANLKIFEDMINITKNNINN